MPASYDTDLAREPIEDDGICETVATYQDGGQVYEIDHLGIGLDSQWGEFSVWTGGNCVAEFAIWESALRPEYRPAQLPVSAGEIIRLARQAVGEMDAER
jgi:hypothetical protein